MKNFTTSFKNIIPLSMIAAIGLICIIFISLLSSCTTEEPVLTTPEEVNERIDMVLEGTLEGQYFLQSNQDDDAIDLVDYHRSAVEISQTSFILNLGNNMQVIFRVHDETVAEPWMIMNNNYSLFAISEIEDKQRYVTAELFTSTESPAYVSTLGDDFPRGTYLNVFRIQEFNPMTNEIFCRIVDFPIAENGNSDNTVMINGTFRGSVIGLQ